MAAPPTVFLICSDLARNGKTLLARVLVDFLLMEGRDPFCFDLAPPAGALRQYFPGRTALLDFAQEEGRTKLFDTLLTRPGRDYVIDLPAAQLSNYCTCAVEADLPTKLQEKGYRSAVLYVVDREEKSLQAAVSLEEVLLPDLFVPVANRFVGSALPDDLPGPVLTMEGMDAELHAVVSNRRFSLRVFMMGDETAVPVRLRGGLKTFLHRLVSGMREFEPALSLQNLREAAV